MPVTYDELLDNFESHLELQGVRLPRAAAADALAAFLSSQFLMFAGPSGTGKSSLARALASFFSPAVSVVDAEPGWMRPQDLAGYASSLGGSPEFVATPATERLTSLHGRSGVLPVLIVEEANLSPIEGYLAPLSHALSAPSARMIRWPLHSHGSVLASRGRSDAPIPPTAMLGEYPRLMATLNVDASAPAPANKVSARSTVILLDPPPLEEVVAIDFKVTSTPAAGDPPGHGVAGNPSDALLQRVSSNTDDVLRSELLSIGEAALASVHRVSPRMALRSLMFQAAYESVCSNAGGELQARRRQHGAENALLHLLLPVLSPSEFTVVAERLVKRADPDGLLAQRLSVLELASEDWRRAPDDFWSGLS